MIIKKSKYIYNYCETKNKIIRLDKIDWYKLSENPNIFEIDTKQLKIDITEKAKFIDSIIYE